MGTALKTRLLRLERQQGRNGHKSEVLTGDPRYDAYLRRTGGLAVFARFLYPLAETLALSDEALLSRVTLGLQTYVRETGFPIRSAEEERPKRFSDGGEEERGWIPIETHWSRWLLFQFMAEVQALLRSGQRERARVVCRHWLHAQDLLKRDEAVVRLDSVDAWLRYVLADYEAEHGPATGKPCRFEVMGEPTSYPDAAVMSAFKCVLALGEGNLSALSAAQRQALAEYLAGKCPENAEAYSQAMLGEREEGEVHR
jgi:hypothetical protein